MKTKKFQKKLFLGKQTIMNLNLSEMKVVHAGGPATGDTCDTDCFMTRECPTDMTCDSCYTDNTWCCTACTFCGPQCS